MHHKSAAAALRTVREVFAQMILNPEAIPSDRLGGVCDYLEAIAEATRRRQARAVATAGTVETAGRRRARPAHTAVV